nr:WYL domain-containing protein [Amycolatopsis rubida]
MSYGDAKGQKTERDVEPLGLLWGLAGWYVLGWCRLRDAVRGFRLDRIRALALTGGRVERREVELPRIPALWCRMGNEDASLAHRRSPPVLRCQTPA